MTDISTFILSAVVCMLAVIACTLLVSLSLKLYTEIMKEKVISSRTKEHKCACPPILPTAIYPQCPFVTGTAVTQRTNPPPPADVKPPPPTKRVPLRDAIIIAQKLMKRKRRV